MRLQSSISSLYGMWKFLLLTICVRRCAHLVWEWPWKSMTFQQHNSNIINLERRVLCIFLFCIFILLIFIVKFMIRNSRKGHKWLREWSILQRSLCLFCWLFFFGSICSLISFFYCRFFCCLVCENII